MSTPTVRTGKEYSHLDAIGGGGPGCDLVCAITQSGVNANMRQYVGQGSFPATFQTWVYDSSNPDSENGKMMDGQDFVKLYGIDPFSIPGTANPADPNDPYAKQFEILKDTSAFMSGLKAQIGLPSNIDPLKMEIVNFLAGTGAVVFNMYCSTFEVCQLSRTGGGRGPWIWQNFSQEKSPNPWVVSSTVDLYTYEVAYKDIPNYVVKNLDSVGGVEAFSVQQLLYDLEKAQLKSSIAIDSLDIAPNTKEAFKTIFATQYFDAMQKTKTPVLATYAISKTQEKGALKPTALETQVIPWSGSTIPNQSSFATINYFCAVEGHELGQNLTVAWNWITPAPSSSTQTNYGIMALKRETLANLLVPQLLKQANANCYTPHTDATSVPEWEFPYFKPDLSAWVTNDGVPNYVINPTGPTVVTISYEGAHESTTGANGCVGQVELKPSYTCTVTFQDSQIIVYQNVKSWLRVQVYQSGVEGNYIDKSQTDKYDLSLTPSGGIQMTRHAGSPVDNSQNSGTNWLINGFTHINEMLHKLQGQAWIKTKIQLDEFPLNTIQNLFYPGGQVFNFSDASFSNYQDLVANIVYQAPA